MRRFRPPRGTCIPCLTQTRRTSTRSKEFCATSESDVVWGELPVTSLVSATRVTTVRGAITPEARNLRQRKRQPCRLVLSQVARPQADVELASARQRGSGLPLLRPGRWSTLRPTGEIEECASPAWALPRPTSRRQLTRLSRHARYPHESHQRRILRTQMHRWFARTRGLRMRDAANAASVRTVSATIDMLAACQVAMSPSSRGKRMTTSMAASRRRR
jgi:hypothetical protein